MMMPTAEALCQGAQYPFLLIMCQSPSAHQDDSILHGAHICTVRRGWKLKVRKCNLWVIRPQFPPPMSLALPRALPFPERCQSLNKPLSPYYVFSQLCLCKACLFHCGYKYLLMRQDAVPLAKGDRSLWVGFTLFTSHNCFSVNTTIILMIG